MIRITDFGYNVDLHLNKEETGMVLEYALDMMEERDANNQATETERAAKRSTEIFPDSFQVDATDPGEMEQCFTGREWLFMAHLTHIINETHVLPDFKLMGFINEASGERGIEVESGNKSLEIPLNKGCGLFAIMADVVAAVNTLKNGF